MTGLTGLDLSLLILLTLSSGLLPFFFVLSAASRLSSFLAILLPMAELTHTIESVPSLLKELEARVESIRDSL